MTTTTGTLARQSYNARRATPTYDAAFLNTELRAIQRAISRPMARTVTGDTTIAATDDGGLVEADAAGGAITVTLPPADRVQFLSVTVKRVNSGANAVTLSGTVDGTVNPTLGSQWAAITIMSNGTAWRKLGSV